MNRNYGKLTLSRDRCFKKSTKKCMQEISSGYVDECRLNETLGKQTT